MKIIKPLTPWSHEYGDFIYGENDFLGKFHKKMLSKEILFLSYMNTNTWNSLKTLGVTNVE